MRRTKIIATLGPATDNPAVLRALLEAGADVVRLNAAHAGPAELAERLSAVRALEGEIGRHVGVLLDLPGPKLRVGEVAGEVALAVGARFALVPGECVGSAERVCVTYAHLASDLQPGDRVLLDDGRLELEVEAIEGADVITRVRVGGPLRSRKGVNVPGRTLGVDAITPRDEVVLAWAQEAEVDWIAQSFVRCADDIDQLRRLMTERHIPVVAKIEKHEAVADLEAIVAAADAVMVARGDLGVETSAEEVPAIQRRVIAQARRLGKPVVVATQMLESMTAAPRPTRAEASDVANAIFERVDACMLSAETAVGEYPVEAVATMARIATTSEEVVAHQDHEHTGELTASVTEAVSAAVCDLAADLSLAAIIPVTETGSTALSVARHRPDTPIIAATPNPSVARMLALVWGVRALIVPCDLDTEDLLRAAVDVVRSAGLAQPGERVALTAGRSTRVPGGTDFILVSPV